MDAASNAAGCGCVAAMNRSAVRGSTVINAIIRRFESEAAAGVLAPPDWNLNCSSLMPEVLFMKYLPIICVGAALLTSVGCATKSYVQKSIDPVNGKVDAQGQQISQTSQSLQKTQQTLETDETALSATKETATSA